MLGIKNYPQRSMKAGGASRFNTIASLNLDFELQKKGAWPSWAFRGGLHVRALPSVNKEQANAQRRVALCPSSKIQKKGAFWLKARFR
jgi:hypothetical protein